MSKTKKTFIRTMEYVLYEILNAVSLMLGLGVAAGLFVMILNGGIGFAIAMLCCYGAIRLTAFLESCRFYVWFRKLFPEVYRY